MKWLYILLALTLLLMGWYVVDRAVQMQQVMRWQGEIIACQQAVIDSLCQVIYWRGRYDQRWKSMAGANLQQLNCISVVMDSANHDKLDSFNDWWEGIR